MKLVSSNEFNSSGKRIIKASDLTPALIMELDPRLKIIESYLKNISDDGDSFNANDVWYGCSKYPSVKHLMSELVGYHRKNDHLNVLQSSHAYDLMYGYFYNLLPDCRNPE